MIQKQKLIEKRLDLIADALRSEFESYKGSRNFPFKGLRFLNSQDYDELLTSHRILAKAISLDNELRSYGIPTNDQRYSSHLHLINEVYSLIGRPTSDLVTKIESENLTHENNVRNAFNQILGREGNLELVFNVYQRSKRIIKPVYTEDGKVKKMTRTMYKKAECLRRIISPEEQYFLFN